MSAWGRPYLSTALGLALFGACAPQGADNSEDQTDDGSSTTGDQTASQGAADDSVGDESKNDDTTALPTARALEAEGSCCPSGDCLCHGEPPPFGGYEFGPYDYDDYDISSGSVYYPTDAEPPFAGIAICGGFTNTGPEMASWAWFYASWGIVTVVTWTGALDFPNGRAWALEGAVEELKGENSNAFSPLNGKMSDRYGTSGYSMGGGATTITVLDDPTLKTSVSLAPWGPSTSLFATVPVLSMCGTIDLIAGCTGGAWSVYSGTPDSVPKMYLEFASSGHITSWFGPGDSGSGMSGEKALAFQKVFLEGDERWRDNLIGSAGLATMVTNITASGDNWAPSSSSGDDSADDSSWWSRLFD